MEPVCEEGLLIGDIMWSIERQKQMLERLTQRVLDLNDIISSRKTRSSVIEYPGDNGIYSEKISEDVD